MVLANQTDIEDHVDVGTPAILAPVTLGGYPLWAFVAVGVVISIVFVILISLVIYFARRQRPKPLDLQEGQYAPVAAKIKESLVSQLTTSAESSVESMEGQPKRAGHRMLRPSLSMDVEIPFHLKRQNVQPTAAIPRWNSLQSPRPSIGALQPDIYRSSDSEDGTAPPCEAGRLWYSITYKKDDAELAVALIRAKYLPGRGFNKGVRDPFVKVFLLPDEENFYQSRVRKRTLSPKFNEVFTFKVVEEELKTRCLRFTVYDVDKRKVRHCLGHAMIPLAQADLDSNRILWRDLEKSPQMRKEGELQLSLMCNPYNNKLKVTICKIQNVQGLEGGDASVYVKVHLYHGHKLVKSKRTSPQRVVGPSKTELIFHESLSFAVPARFYDSCYVQTVTFVSGGALLKDVALGKVTIGPYLFSRGEQLLHWQEMITNPRSVVTRWHTLVPFT